MVIIKTVEDLQKFLKRQRNLGNTIGFAPTMGALHQGHLSLIDFAKSNTDFVVASIFVNPSQFNEIEDLENYPRTTGQDIKLLTEKGCHLLFLPEVSDVYPPEINVKVDVDFQHLMEVMEGEFRPGHFEGMAEVVKRLLDIVKPDQLFMGQKDFQQMSIVNKMIRSLKLPVKLVGCPIVRAESGLALSSRNRRLSEQERKEASLLYSLLTQTKEAMHDVSPPEGSSHAMKAFKDAGFRPEYFAIVDGYTLETITNYDDHDFVVACTAVWVGEIRLIDNMVLKGHQG